MSIRDTYITCRSCGLRKRYFSRGRCRTCADAELPPAVQAARKRRQQEYEQKRYSEQRKGQAGSWADPKVQQHHRRMIQKYFGEHL